MAEALAQWLALLAAGWVLARAIPISAGRRGLALVGGVLTALFVSSWTLFVANQVFGVAVSVAAQLLVAAAIAAVGLALRPRPPSTLADAAPLTRAEVALAGAAIAAFAITSAEMLLRPYADIDGWMYHLPLARELIGGSFPSHFGRSTLGGYESAYPPHLSYLYALAVRGAPLTVWPLITKWVQLGVHAAGCAYVWALARDRFGLSRVSALSVLLFAALRFPIGIDPEGEVAALQMLSALYVLAALYHGWDVWLGAPEGARTATLWGGVLLGGAYWDNYAALPLAACLIAGAALSRRLAREPAPALVPMVVAGGIFAALAGVHLLRNALVLGNPIYPALEGVLGGIEVTPWYLANRHTITAPVPVTPATLHRAFFGGTMTLVPVAALLTLVLAPVRRRAFFAVLIGGYVVVWLQALQFYGIFTWRYLVPLWVPSLLAIALVFEALPVRRKAWALVVLAAMHPFLYWVRIAAPDWPAFWAAAAGLVLVALGARVAARRWSSGPDGWVAGLGVAAIFVHFVATSLMFRPWLLLGVAAGCTALAVLVTPRLAALTPQRRGATAAAAAAGLIALALAIDLRRPGSVADDAIMREDIGWLNANAGPADRVLMYEMYTLPLSVRWLAADSLEAEPALTAADDATALDALRAMGVSLVWFSHRLPWEPFDEGLRARLERLSAPVYQRGDGAIFRISTPSPSTPRPRRAHSGSRPRGWSSPSR